MIEVPEALRKGIRPRRSIPGSASAPTEASAKRMLARIGKLYPEEKHFWPKTSHAAIFAAGLKTDREPELNALRRDAHRFLLEPTPEAVARASHDVLAAAHVMAGRVDRDLDLLAVAAGLLGVEQALSVAVKSTYYMLGAGVGGWTTAVFVLKREKCTTHGDAWLALRHAVCASDDYPSAVKAADALRIGLDAGRRALLAYTFPDERWANEDLAEHPSAQFLLGAATDIDVIQRSDPRPLAISDHALDLVLALRPQEVLPLLGATLPALLVKPKHGPLHKTPPRKIAEAIACLRTTAAARILSPYASNAILAPIVLGFFRDNPELANAGEGDIVRRVVAKKSTNQERVAAPSVLRERPWRNEGNASAAVVSGLSIAARGESVVAPPGVPCFERSAGANIRGMTKKGLAAWRKKVEKEEVSYADYVPESRTTSSGYRFEYLRVPEKERLWAWNEHGARLTMSPLELVQKHGLRSLPGFLRRDWIRYLGQSEDDGSMLFSVMCFRSPRVAPLLARVAARRKKFRRVALGWLVDNAAAAALGLVPDAVGAPGEARDDAEAALLYLATHDERAVRAAAKHYGAAAAREVGALLGRDPLAIGVSPPKPPAFLRLAELPSIFDGHATAALVEMLQITKVDPVYPGVDAVRRAGDVAPLAFGLLEQWVIGDAPGRHEWMLFAAVHFPSEAATRRIAGLAREWARKNQAKAARACLALSLLRTDFALMHLAHIAETTRFDALRTDADELLLEAAAARGLTLDELGDRTVPDLGLAPDGTLSLAYGKRRFKVTLDEELRPVILDDAGDRLRALPRPAKGEDASAARERVGDLRRDLAAIADRQKRRLERAMAKARRWSVADFKTFLVGHPLTLHLARRLVWVAEPPGKQRASCTFRVAEDGSLADVRDAKLELRDERAVVRIAHPAVDDLEHWVQVFADYEIVQPFEQLGRGIFKVAPKERRATTLERTAGVSASARKVLGMLESRGFRRDARGHVSAFIRDAVRIPLSPGIPIDSLKWCADPVLGAATLDDGGAFGTLDPIAFSELVRDVEALRAR